jgi:acetyl esterase/lipase
MALTLDVYRPRNPNGAAVLFINSGGFVSGQARHYDSLAWDRYRFLAPTELHLVGDTTPIPLLEQFSFAQLLASRFTVFDVRHGSSPKFHSSPKFQLPEILEDLKQAVRFVRLHAGQWGVDPERLGVWGASSGGYLALFLGFTGDDGNAQASDSLSRVSSRVQAIATYYPAGYDFASDAKRFPDLITNLPALQVDHAVLDSLSLKHHVSASAPPTFIVYGTDDFPFIVEPSESVYVSLTRVGVEARRIAIPGTGHEFRGEDGYHAKHGRRALQEVTQWFREQLGEGPDGGM